MSLADDIRLLRDRVLADLNAAHDYHNESVFAWRTIHDLILFGTRFSFQNAVTGTISTQAEVLHKSLGYVSGQLTEATFQQFISIFEGFFFDFLRLWIAAYPRNLLGKKVDFKAILEAPDKDAIILLAVNKELNEVLYERPTSWFAYLEEKVKLGCPTVDEIDRIAEAKASRDVLVHNRGIAGKSYESKAGRFARYKDGERIDISEPYHRQIWEVIRKVVADISNAAIAKFS
ncbi:MAG TPA: hypothetical protein VN688_11610 [Gemmataceae bacterium]|nr:hypothetical protein [Gemmataceae bacterium]